MKNIQFTYLEWRRYGKSVDSAENRLLRFDSSTDRDYWRDKFNSLGGPAEAQDVEPDDSAVTAKYDLDDFYTDCFKEGDRCPSGHFYYEIPPRESFLLEN